jgi:helix-turn-helix protein
VPQRGLSRRQITEVLRLAAQGLSCRQIGQSVGISASTAQGYLQRARAAGLNWPLADGLDDRRRPDPGRRHPGPAGPQRPPALAARQLAAPPPAAATTRDPARALTIAPTLEPGGDARA